MKEELDAALGAAKSVRVGDTRQGYRHGTRERTLTTSLGPASFAMPRARIHQAAERAPNGRARRCGAISDGRRASMKRSWAYLAGRNTRRITGALAPLLRGGPLSKDAVSRLVGRLREDFEMWRGRDLADEDMRDVFMDGCIPRCGSVGAASACQCR